MPYVVITTERPEGPAALCERVGTADFEADHFKACLADRLAWAVSDAEREVAGATPAADHALARG